MMADIQAQGAAAAARQSNNHAGDLEATDTAELQAGNQDDNSEPAKPNGMHAATGDADADVGMQVIDANVPEDNAEDTQRANGESMHSSWYDCHGGLCTKATMAIGRSWLGRTLHAANAIANTHTGLQGMIRSHSRRGHPAPARHAHDKLVQLRS